jgi:hypothetical protein
MFQLTLWLILLCPYLGLIFIAIFPEEYDWLTSGSISLSPLVYYSLFLAGAVVAGIKFNKERLQVVNKLPGVFRSELPALISMFIILVVVFVWYGGVDVLLGFASNEEMRQAGFIYAILTKYLLPSMFAFISARKRAELVSWGEWWLALLMTLAVGLSIGGKAYTLIAALPGLAILFSNRLSIFYVLIIAVSFFVALIFTAWLFDAFLDGDLLVIVGYLMHRAFVLTAEAPYHVGFAHSENQPTIEYQLTLLEVLGRSVLSIFIEPTDLPKYLFSHAVTAWLYPGNIDAISSGVWNITPNVFVEALIVGGPFLLPFFGWAVVYAAYFLWALVVKQINRGKYINASIVSLYTVMVYLSWTNSAGVTQLIHPLSIASLILSWLSLRLLSRINLKI